MVLHHQHVMALKDVIDSFSVSWEGRDLFEYYSKNSSDFTGKSPLS